MNKKNNVDTEHKKRGVTRGEERGGRNGVKTGQPYDGS